MQKGFFYTRLSVVLHGRYVDITKFKDITEVEIVTEMRSFHFTYEISLDFHLLQLYNYCYKADCIHIP
jgi:hypothetical protein